MKEEAYLQVTYGDNSTVLRLPQYSTSAYLDTSTLCETWDQRSGACLQLLPLALCPQSFSLPSLSKNVAVLSRPVGRAGA